MESPVGPLQLVADDRGVRRIDFVNGRNPVEADPQWHEDAEPLRETIRQLRAYFAGELEASISRWRPKARLSAVSLESFVRNPLRRNHFLR